MSTFRNSLAAIAMLLAFGVQTPAYGAPVGHAPFAGESFQGLPCEGRRENFGPYDYLLRATLPKELGVVERHHFNESVEHLVKGQTSQNPMGDISYTLYAWPNHHRALYSAIRYRLRDYPKYVIPGRTIPTAECFLLRAIQFSPRDGTTYMLYGILLQRTGQLKEALAQYRIARKLRPKDTQIQYNLALVLLELGKADESLALAKKIYATNFPLKGLKKKLTEAGHWK